MKLSHLFSPSLLGATLAALTMMSWSTPVLGQATDCDLPGFGVNIVPKDTDIVEGGSTTLTIQSNATLAQTLITMVNWADGSSNSTYFDPLARKNEPFVFTHKYVQDGQYSVEVMYTTVRFSSATESSVCQKTKRYSVNVTNALPALVLTGVTNEILGPVHNVTVQISCFDAGELDDQAISIDWGDSIYYMSKLTAAAPASVNCQNLTYSHTYNYIFPANSYYGYPVQQYTISAAVFDGKKEVVSKYPVYVAACKAPVVKGYAAEVTPFAQTGFTYTVPIAGQYAISKIDWGDNLPNTGGTQNLHTYQKVGNYNVSVTFNCPAPSKYTVTTTYPVSVVSACLFPTANIVNGTSTIFSQGDNISVAFSSNVTASYTAKVDWGDGATPDAKNSDSQNNALLTHTYMRDSESQPKKLFKIVASYNGTAKSNYSGIFAKEVCQGSTELFARVRNVAPTCVLSGIPNTTQLAPYGVNVVLACSDPGLSDGAKVTIFWDMGIEEKFTMKAPLSDNPLKADRFFERPGRYNIYAKVTGDGVDPVTTDMVPLTLRALTISLNNIPSTMQKAPYNVTAVVKFENPSAFDNSKATYVSIDGGDGAECENPTRLVTGPAPLKDVSFICSYYFRGTYYIRVNATDGTVTEKRGTSLEIAAKTGQYLFEVTPTQGQAAPFNATAKVFFDKYSSFNQAKTASVSIYWGPGSGCTNETSVITGPAKVNRAVNFNCLYYNGGNYTVTVKVTDGTATETQSAVVAIAPRKTPSFKILGLPAAPTQVPSAPYNAAAQIQFDQLSAFNLASSTSATISWGPASGCADETVVVTGAVTAKNVSFKNCTFYNADDHKISVTAKGGTFTETQNTTLSFKPTSFLNVKAASSSKPTAVADLSFASPSNFDQASETSVTIYWGPGDPLCTNQTKVVKGPAPLKTVSFNCSYAYFGTKSVMVTVTGGKVTETANTTVFLAAGGRGSRYLR